MIKKILIILSILAPFIGYYFIKLVFKLSSKKFPVLSLSIISLILLIITLLYFRFDNNFLPDTQYTPPKMENGKIKPAENN
tara:strand:- start:20438 stop:20680 length:243 start_codon:yes stop_codon:yes gene_type:complete